MNVNYFIRLSFHKLETFDVNRTSLSTFVLVRNSLISALTEHKNDYNNEDIEQDIILEEDDYYDDDDEDEEEEGEVWLDSCFDQLEQEEEQAKEEEDDSDEDMPLSPRQEDDNDDFYSKDQNQALIRYDLPLFLS